MKKFAIVMIVLILTMTNNLTICSAYDAKLPKDYIDIIKPYFPTSSKASPDMIIGDESWSDVQNTSQFPYAAIAYLQIYFSDLNSPNNATGFMISNKCMLTAGHIFYHYDKDGKLHTAEKIVAYFGVPLNAKNPTDSYTYMITTTPDTATYYYQVMENNVYDSTIDNAAIIFNSEIGKSTGHFGVRIYNSDEKFKALNVIVTAYSRFDTNNNGKLDSIKMKTDTGKITSLNNPSFKHSADTQAGMSGGPVYESDNYAVGINVGQSTDAANQFNIGYRITQEFINILTSLGYK